MTYKFPNNWHLNIDSPEKLAKRLVLPLSFVMNVEKQAQRYYRHVPNNERPIVAPKKNLKLIQRRIVKYLFNYKFPPWMQGGIPGKSIITNASIHVQKKWVACLDIEKFYPSVHNERVHDVFLNLGCPDPLSTFLTHLTTLNFELPQGAPTSPILSNLILYNLDLRISKFCSIKGVAYSRYFDDITVSGNKRLENICDKIMKIIKIEGFKVHAKGSYKFSIKSNSEIQIVTGLIVNGRKLKASSDFIEELNKTIRSIEKEPSFKLLDKAKGMIAFLNSVERTRARQYQNRLEKLLMILPGPS